jgi:hypothetical protein
MCRVPVVVNRNWIGIIHQVGVGRSLRIKRCCLDFDDKDDKRKKQNLFVSNQNKDYFSIERIIMRIMKKEKHIPINSCFGLG